MVIILRFSLYFAWEKSSRHKKKSLTQTRLNILFIEKCVRKYSGFMIGKKVIAIYVFLTWHFSKCCLIRKSSAIQVRKGQSYVHRKRWTYSGISRTVNCQKAYGTQVPRKKLHDIVQNNIKLFNKHAE